MALNILSIFDVVIFEPKHSKWDTLWWNTGEFVEKWLCSLLLHQVSNAPLVMVGNGWSQPVHHKVCCKSQNVLDELWLLLVKKYCWENEHAWGGCSSQCHVMWNLFACATLPNPTTFYNSSYHAPFHAVLQSICTLIINHASMARNVWLYNSIQPKHHGFDHHSVSQSGRCINHFEEMNAPLTLKISLLESAYKSAFQLLALNGKTTCMKTGEHDRDVRSWQHKMCRVSTNRSQVELHFPCFEMSPVKKSSIKGPSPLPSLIINSEIRVILSQHTSNTSNFPTNQQFTKMKFQLSLLAFLAAQVLAAPSPVAEEPATGVLEKRVTYALWPPFEANANFPQDTPV